MTTILDLDLNRSLYVVEGRIIVKSLSTDNTGRHFLSSTCITAEEMEFWLDLLEADIAEIRKESKRLLNLGEKRDLYWAAFEFDNGGVGTWADYAVTPIEFLDGLKKRWHNRPLKITELQRSTDSFNWETLDFKALGKL